MIIYINIKVKSVLLLHQVYKHQRTTNDTAVSVPISNNATGSSERSHRI